MKILIGYDGSECSDFAVADLRKAGLPPQAEVVVLTVGEAWELPAMVDPLSLGSPKFVHRGAREIREHLAEVREKARKLADVAANRLKEIFPEWNVAAEAVCGKAAVELIKKADEWESDLLVVGSQGRSAIGRILLGSVSHKVLHEARCPVRIAKRNQYGENAGARILVALDGSPHAEETVKTVAARNWAQDAEIRLIAVNDPFAPPAAGYVGWNFGEDKPEDGEEARRWLGKVIDTPADILHRAGLRVSHNVRWGDAASGILEEAEDWQADCVFVGARGLGLFKRFLLGSVSSAIAAKAKCSVEVVRFNSPESP